MISREIDTLRDQLHAAIKAESLNPVGAELLFAKLTDIASRVRELERRSVPPVSRASATDLGNGKVLVLRL